MDMRRIAAVAVRGARGRAVGRSRTAAAAAAAAAAGGGGMRATAPDGWERVLFIETGFGCDAHGQNVTKAAARAARNAIEFNSLPAIREIVPGGYDGMRLRVTLGVPEKYVDGLDTAAVEAVFPYGRVEIDVRVGGLAAPSGVEVDALGDEGDDMVICIAHVQVGY